MNITRGPIQSAKKVGIYGPEGIGKTTFAAQFPGVVFIDTEGSTRHMDVARFDTPETFAQVTEQLAYVLGHPGEIRTVAIDTVDWLEKLIFSAVCEEKKVQNIEEIGYGKGYVFAKQKMQQILEMLDLIVAGGTNAVLICHSIIRKFEQPDDMSSYDRYMLKLNEKNIAPMIKEWVDMLLFANYRTDVVTGADGKTKKGKGGQKRVMYAAHNACWDAKNRFGLPDEMPFEFDQIAEIVNTPAPEKKPVEVEITETKPKKQSRKEKDAPPDRPESMRSDNPDKDILLQKLWGMMCLNDIADPTLIQAVCSDKDYYDANVLVRDYDLDFIEGCLIGAWDTVLELATTKKYDLPF